MHNGMLELAAEKMSKSVGNIRGLGEVLDEVERRGASCSSCAPGTTGSRWRSPTRRSRTRAARPRASATPGGGCSRARRRRRWSRTATRFFAALRNDFNTAEALASLYGWIREANRSEEAVGNAHLVEMLDVLGLVGLIAAEEGAPPEAVALAEQRETARAREGLGRGRPPARRAARAGLGGPRRT